MRTFKIISGTSNPQTVTTNATTWGQLKAEFPHLIPSENVKGIDATNKISLEHNDAKLPNGGSIVVVPAKNKSGGESSDSPLTKEDLAALDSDLFWDFASTHGFNSADGSREEVTQYVIDKVAREMEKTDSILTVAEVDQAVIEEMKAHVNLVKETCDKILENAIKSITEVKKTFDSEKVEWDKIIEEFK